MKKLVLLLGLVGFLFSSCKKEYITESTPNQTIIMTVPSSVWKTDDNGVTYYASLSVPEITPEFNTNGGVLVYISYGNGVFEQVPEVYQGLSYSYTHNTGNVSIYAQNASGTGTVAPPDNVTVKIILVDSVQ